MIEYKNVVLNYQENTVLKNVNLKILDGEFMILVGPSGSGKTTMLKMINRLLEPSDGNIYMDDKRIKDYDERESRIMTYGSYDFLLDMFYSRLHYFLI